ncbi:MAG: hypothetical protein IJV50_00495 [Lachnospiraceae bacterium]|nr:hypothetical protein [Lachnospiraceae bacterium]
MAKWEIDFASRRHIWQSYGTWICLGSELVVFFYCLLRSLFAMGQAGVMVGVACVGIVVLAFVGAYIAYSGLKLKGRIYRNGLKAGLLCNLAVLIGMVALYIWGGSTLSL